MTHVSGPGWLTKTRAALAAGLLGLAGAGLVWAALVGLGTSPPAPSIGTRAESASQAGVESSGPSHPERSAFQQPSASQKPREAAPHSGGIDDPITGLVLPESQPVEISIPRLGVKSSLVGLGIDGAGAMEVPADPAVAGWYTLGPTPGALGSAVIAGHVTWNQTPAVFFRLGSLQSGDRLSIVRKDGNRAIFSVGRVSTFAKAHFPTSTVFGGIDHAGLRLITCGGKYDLFAHRYVDNVVVFATLVDVRPVNG